MLDCAEGAEEGSLLQPVGGGAPGRELRAAQTYRAAPNRGELESVNLLARAIEQLTRR